MKKKVVVFGATGNLGAYVTLALQAEGHEVVAVGHRASDNGFFASRGIPYYSADICRESDFARLPDSGVDAVVHLAGQLPSRYDYNPALLIDSILKGTLNVLEYMRRCGATRIVFPQTPFDLSAYHNGTEPIPADAPRTFPLTGDHAVYTIAKNAAVDLIEHYHATYGFSRFILRFFTIYQYHPNPYHYGDGVRKMMPYRILMEKAMRGEEIEIWGDPARAKEMVYVRDFTQVVNRCIDSALPGGIYNVGGPACVTLEEQIRGIIAVFSPEDRKSPVRYRPEMPDALQARFDISKTRRELGYEPAYGYLESLIDFRKEMEEEPFALLWGKGADYCT